MVKIRPEWFRIWEQSDIEQSEMNLRFETKTINALEKNFKKGGIVLEAGCGSGRYCFWLKEKGIKAVGVDIAHNAVYKGLKSAKKNGIYPVFVVGTVTRLPIKDKVFDGYISLGVIEHFRSKNEVIYAFKEAFRVLRQGGVAYFTIPNLFEVFRWKIINYLIPERGIYHTSYSRKELADFSRLAGFEIKEIGAHDAWISIYYLIIDIIGRGGREQWKLKYILMKVLSPLDNFPLLGSVLGGVHIILKKR